MTAALSTTGRIQPGGFDDFVARAAEAAGILGRLGTAPPRLHPGGWAGEAFWTWVGAYARVMGAFTNEAGNRAVAAEGMGADATDTVVFEGLYGEVPS